MSIPKKKSKELLKSNLVHFPPDNEYHTPESLIIKISVKKEVRHRHYTFGGPHWSASIYFSENSIHLRYFSPLKKTKEIDFNEIVRIEFAYLA